MGSRKLINLLEQYNKRQRRIARKLRFDISSVNARSLIFAFVLTLSAGSLSLTAYERFGTNLEFEQSAEKNVGSALEPRGSLDADGSVAGTSTKENILQTR